MTMTRFAIVFGLLGGLGGCSDMMSGGSSSAPRSAAAVQPIVASDMVRQVQSKLRDDGYYKQGAVDGVWGLGTETAVRSFQRDHNLGSSGQLDVPTLQALNLVGGPQAANDARRYNPATTQPLRTESNPPLTDNNAPYPAR